MENSRFGEEERGVTLNDFIGIFPNAASKEYCDKVITRFNYLQEIQDIGRGKIWSRDEEEGVLPTLKDNATYFLGGVQKDQLPLDEKEELVVSHDMPLLVEFTEIMWNCYKEYANRFGELQVLAEHNIACSVRIQKYKPSQGYHMWHCDATGVEINRRVLVVMLYLNTIEEGGETEFLYQSRRISPVQGTLVFFPPAWTHTHRGNPPLKGTKYVMVSWLEFTK